MTETVTPERVDAARAAMEAVAKDKDAAEVNLAQLKRIWSEARDEWLRLVVALGKIEDDD